VKIKKAGTRLKFGEGIWGEFPKQEENHCPECGAPPEEFELRDYDMIWHDGRVHCRKCDAFIRNWDAG
jgi:hypothetical protein